MVACLALSAVCIYPVRASATPILEWIDTGLSIAVTLGNLIDVAQAFGSHRGYTPGKLQINFNESTDFLSFSLVGRQITSKTENTFSFTGDNWRVQFTINEYLGLINDDLSINGFVQHTIATHWMETPIGPSLNYNLFVDADNEKNSKVSARDSGEQEHPGRGHKDVYTADLTATVRSSFFADSITGYTFNLTAQHVSEPSLLFLIGAGIVGLFLSPKEKRKQIVLSKIGTGVTQ